MGEERWGWRGEAQQGEAGRVSQALVTTSTGFVAVSARASDQPRRGWLRVIGGTSEGPAHRPVAASTLLLTCSSHALHAGTVMEASGDQVRPSAQRASLEVGDSKRHCCLRAPDNKPRASAAVASCICSCFILAPGLPLVTKAMEVTRVWGRRERDLAKVTADDDWWAAQPDVSIASRYPEARCGIKLNLCMCV